MLADRFDGCVMRNDPILVISVPILFIAAERDHFTIGTPPQAPTCQHDDRRSGGDTGCQQHKIDSHGVSGQQQMILGRVNPACSMMHSSTLPVMLNRKV